MKHLTTTLITLSLAILLLGACVPAPAAPASPVALPTAAAVANPASENCIKQGGTVSIVAAGTAGSTASAPSKTTGSPLPGMVPNAKNGHCCAATAR